VNFKLLIPETGNGMNEVFATTLFRSLGFIAPETFEVNTSINNVKSIMLFQEKARKELLERNHRREGPIFRGDEVLMWGYENYKDKELESLLLSTLYNKSWFKKGYSSQQIILSAYAKLQSSSLISRYHQKILLGAQSYLIPDLVSEVFYNDFMGVLIAMDGYHGLYLNNRKHYYNVIAGIFEPIYYDGNVDLSRDWTTPPINFLLPVRVSEHLFFKAQGLDVNSKLKDEFIERIKNQKQAHIFFNDSLAKFKSNLAKIQLQNNSIEDVRKPISIARDSLYSSIISSYIGFQKAKLLNQKVIKSIWHTGDSYQATLDDQSILALNEDQVLEVISKNKLYENRIVYIPSSVDILENQDSKIKEISIDRMKITMSEGMSVTHNLTEKRLVFHQSQLSDWALIHDSYVNGWAISLNGLISSSAKSLSEQRFNARGITGCLTIYNSELIDTSLFVANGQCEDSLNLISTSGKKIAISIKDSYADAVDADFSSLEIKNLKIINAGNDCFDVSGGKYSVGVSELKDCSDKGISIGEKSYFEGDEIFIENASIGISAKDFSQAIVKRLSAKNVLVCGEAKRKKQEFGGGELFIEKTDCNESYFFSDNESIVRLRD
jgi:hypothetical protein